MLKAADPDAHQDSPCCVSFGKTPAALRLGAVRAST